MKINKYLIVLILLLITTASANTASATWWNDSWELKVPIQIHNTNTSTLSNYQIQYNITYNSNIQNDFDDIRFINDPTSQSMPYWIESKLNGSYANVFINITSIPASSWLNDTIYMYYNNSGAISESSGTNTFLRYHDSSTTTFFDNLFVSVPSIAVQWKIKLATSYSNVNVGASSTSTNDAGDYLKLSMQSADTYLQTANASTQTVTSMGGAPTAGSTDIYRIEYPNSTTITAYKNGILKATTATKYPRIPVSLFADKFANPSFTMNYSFISKNVYPNPTVSLGNEQNNIDFGGNWYAHAEKAVTSSVWNLYACAGNLSGTSYLYTPKGHFVLAHAITNNTCYGVNVETDDLVNNIDGDGQVGQWSYLVANGVITDPDSSIRASSQFYIYNSTNVSITSFPNGVDITIDGTYIGKTPLVFNTNYVQILGITYSLDGYYPFTIMVNTSETTSVNHVMVSSNYESQNAEVLNTGLFAAIIIIVAFTAIGFVYGSEIGAIMGAVSGFIMSAYFGLIESWMLILFAIVVFIAFSAMLASKISSPK